MTNIINFKQIDLSKKIIVLVVKNEDIENEIEVCLDGIDTNPPPYYITWEYLAKDITHYIEDNIGRLKNSIYTDIIEAVMACRPIPIDEQAQLRQKELKKQGLSDLEVFVKIVKEFYKKSQGLLSRNLSLVIDSYSSGEYVSNDGMGVRETTHNLYQHYEQYVLILNNVNFIFYQEVAGDKWAQLGALTRNSDLSVVDVTDDNFVSVTLDEVVSLLNI